MALAVRGSISSTSAAIQPRRPPGPSTWYHAPERPSKPTVAPASNTARTGCSVPGPARRLATTATRPRGASGVAGAGEAVGVSAGSAGVGGKGVTLGRRARVGPGVGRGGSTAVASPQAPSRSGASATMTPTSRGYAIPAMPHRPACNRASNPALDTTNQGACFLQTPRKPGRGEWI